MNENKNVCLSIKALYEAHNDGVLTYTDILHETDRDIDVHKYLLLDTRVRDYFDDICFKIFESLDDCEEA